MNLLVEALQLGRLDDVAGARNVATLPDVAAAMDLVVPVAMTPESEEVYGRAAVRFERADSWARRSFEPLPDDVEPARWGVALPVLGGEVLAFVPDDSRPEPDLALFSGIGSLPGRLRLAMPDGIGGRITDVTFEAGLHCADVDCLFDHECPQCCEDCLCRTRNEGLGTVVVCGCTEHQL